jgi:hypothetical protein
MRDSPKPIPSTPTHCRGCGQELEPLRRWGGLCRTCVRALPHGALRDRISVQWIVIGHFARKRRDGIKERCVRLRCTCGTERTMSLAEWTHRRSLRCNRCRLRDQRAHGVDSDYGCTADDIEA